MRKVSFNVSYSRGYDGVPIPDNLTTSRQIFEYLEEHLDEFDRYLDGNMDLYQNSFYSAIVTDDNGDEHDITVDDQK